MPTGTGDRADPGPEEGRTTPRSQASPTPVTGHDGRTQLSGFLISRRWGRVGSPGESMTGRPAARRIRTSGTSRARARARARRSLIPAGSSPRTRPRIVSRGHRHATDVKPLPGSHRARTAGAARVAAGPGRPSAKGRRRTGEEPPVRIPPTRTAAPPRGFYGQGEAGVERPIPLERVS